MYRITVLDANDNILGDGPLPNVTSLNNTERLDEIDEADFTLPANQPETALIQPGCKFRLEDPGGDGLLGTYLFKNRKLTDQNGVATLAVSLYGPQMELTRNTVGFRRSYNNALLSQVLNDLAALAGWTVVLDSSLSSSRTVLSMEAESPYRGIDELRDRFGHFRLAGEKVLEFGPFGEDSGVRLVNLSAQVPKELAEADDIGIITQITVEEEADEIFNCIIPLGTGQGEAALGIGEASSGGTYLIKSRANQDGSNSFYIQDDSSVAQYGERWKVLSLPQIRPLDNSQTARSLAALTLKLTAESFLKKHLSPRQTITIGQVHKLPPLKVGQKVRVIYKGIAEGYGYVNVDDLFWVMEIRKSRSATGQRNSSLVLSNTDGKRTTDGDVVTEMAKNISVMKSHIQSGVSQAFVSQMIGVQASPQVVGGFSIPLGLETQLVVSARIRFITSPLRSTVQGVAGGGGVVSSSGSGGGAVTSSGSGGGVVKSSGGGGGVVSAGTTEETSVVEVWKNIPDDGPFFALGLKYTGGVNAVLVYDGGGGSNTLTVPMGSVQSNGKHVHEINLPQHTHQLNVPDHTHSINIPAHTHNITLPEHTHPMAYGFFDDSLYPSSIYVRVNGQTVAGPFGSGTGSATEVNDLVITDYLNQSPGPQRRHRIEFVCTQGRGTIDVVVSLTTVVQAVKLD